YSGCPAMGVIEQDIKEKLSKEGFINFKIDTVLTPAWTTDWISEEGRKKLKLYGIAPPENEPDKSVLFADPVKVQCPKCGSRDTRMVSQFGSTACKAHYQCNNCLEPFDYFKCLK
ncbi:MAG: 1,2-phenylacetyl-CoA epoxidase subunit PaaD, partial [Fluviicola sp.]